MALPLSRRTCQRTLPVWQSSRGQGAAAVLVVGHNDQIFEANERHAEAMLRLDRPEVGLPHRLARVIQCQNGVSFRRGPAHVDPLGVHRGSAVGEVVALVQLVGLVLPFALPERLAIDGVQPHREPLAGRVVARRDEDLLAPNLGLEWPVPGRATFQLKSCSVHFTGMAPSPRPEPLGPRNRVHSCAQVSDTMVKPSSPARSHRHRGVFIECSLLSEVDVANPSPRTDRRDRPTLILQATLC